MGANNAIARVFQRAAGGFVVGLAEKVDFHFFHVLAQMLVAGRPRLAPQTQMCKDSRLIRARQGIGIDIDLLVAPVQNVGKADHLSIWPEDQQRLIVQIRAHPILQQLFHAHVRRISQRGLAGVHHIYHQRCFIPCGRAQGERVGSLGLGGCL